MASMMRRRSQGPNWRTDKEYDEERRGPRQKRRPWRRLLLVLSTRFTTIAYLSFGIFACLLLILSFKQDGFVEWMATFDRGPHDDGAFRSILRPEVHASRNVTTIEHHWRVTKSHRRPDGVLKNIYLINDAFPGPTVEARPGDRLIIYVQNDMVDESLSIHWHGLYMRSANDMDGAVGVTQSPIASGSAFVYDFTLDAEQHGTFWYHAHDGVQRADGLYGGLIIHEPMVNDAIQYSSTEEHLLLIGDWYHRSAEDALHFYSHQGAYGLETVPDSILVNGHGVFVCANAVPARPIDCHESRKGFPASSLHLNPTKRNILRVVNTGAYTGFSVEISGSSLTPLTVDGGHSIDGTPSSSIGVLHPGERVSLLVECKSVTKNGSSQLSVTVDDTPFKYENSALTPIHNYAIQWSEQATLSHSTLGSSQDAFDIQMAGSREDQNTILPQEADQVIVLYTMTQKLSHLDNVPRGFINHTTWSPQESPLISLPPSDWNADQFVPQITYNATHPLWIDIVLNNLDEDSHPFHLHGHDFWVLASYTSDLSWGSYNPFEDHEPPGGAYNLVKPVRKDTFYVPRRGYAVLRFRADNPGLWMFHCHVLWHQATGMAMVFAVNDV